MFYLHLCSLFCQLHPYFPVKGASPSFQLRGTISEVNFFQTPAGSLLSSADYALAYYSAPMSIPACCLACALHTACVHAASFPAHCPLPCAPHGCSLCATHVCATHARALHAPCAGALCTPCGRSLHTAHTHAPHATCAVLVPCTPPHLCPCPVHPPRLCLCPAHPPAPVPVPCAPSTPIPCAPSCLSTATPPVPMPTCRRCPFPCPAHPLHLCPCPVTPHTCACDRRIPAPVPMPLRCLDPHLSVRAPMPQPCAPPRPSPCVPTMCAPCVPTVHVPACCHARTLCTVRALCTVHSVPVALAPLANSGHWWCANVAPLPSTTYLNQCISPLHFRCTSPPRELQGCASTGGLSHLGHPQIGSNWAYTLPNWDWAPRMTWLDAPYLFFGLPCTILHHRDFCA